MHASYINKTLRNLKAIFQVISTLSVNGDSNHKNIASMKRIKKNWSVDASKLNDHFVLYNIKLRKRILPRLQYLQTDVLLYSQALEFQKNFFLFSSEMKYLDFSSIKIKKK